MIHIKKWTKKDFLIFCLASLYAGCMLGVGDLGLLVAVSMLGNTTGRIVGALMFALSMFVVTELGLNLATGLSTRVAEMGKNSFWILPISLCFNVIGLTVTSYLIRLSHLDVLTTANLFMDTRMDDPQWWIRALFSGILCGILIGLSVVLPRYAEKKHLSATVGLIFPVFVYAFCGLDNSLANVFFTLLCDKITWGMVGYCAISLIGNWMGCIFLSVAPQLTGKNKLAVDDDEEGEDDDK